MLIPATAEARTFVSSLIDHNGNPMFHLKWKGEKDMYEVFLKRRCVSNTIFRVESLDAILMIIQKYDLHPSWMINGEEGFIKVDPIKGLNSGESLYNHVNADPHKTLPFHSPDYMYFDAPNWEHQVARTSTIREYGARFTSEYPQLQEREGELKDLVWNSFILSPKTWIPSWEQAEAAALLQLFNPAIQGESLVSSIFWCAQSTRAIFTEKGLSGILASTELHVIDPPVEISYIYDSFSFKWEQIIEIGTMLKSIPLGEEVTVLPMSKWSTPQGWLNGEYGGLTHKTWAIINNVIEEKKYYSREYYALDGNTYGGAQPKVNTDYSIILRERRSQELNGEVIHDDSWTIYLA